MRSKAEITSPMKIPCKGRRSISVMHMRRRVVRWLLTHSVEFTTTPSNLSIAYKIFEMCDHKALIGNFGKRRGREALVAAHHLIGGKTMTVVEGKRETWAIRRARTAKNNRMKEFYESYEWLKLRYKTLKAFGSVCMACKRPASDEVIIHVDHIKSVRKYWYLRLDPDNLQVLCSECNHGKGNWDETDWRSLDAKNKV